MPNQYSGNYVHYVGTGTATYTYQQQAWNDWTSTTISNQTWGYWVDQSNSTASANNQTPLYDPQLFEYKCQVWRSWLANPTTAATWIPLTDEERYLNSSWGTWTDKTWQRKNAEAVNQRRLALNAQRACAEQEARNRLLLAQRKAMDLLTAVLSDEQRQSMLIEQRIHVTGSRGRRYCIRTRGQSGNVHLLTPEGATQARLCVHPSGVPDPDAWLAQMLAIQNDEDAFLTVANVHEGTLPAEVVELRHATRSRHLVGAAA